MEFELQESSRGQPDEVLLDDMRRCAATLGRATITMEQYAELGKFHPSTMQRRFKSWPDALRLAGLAPSRSKIGITDDELFENIKRLWTELGRQPKYGEVKRPHSLYSAGTYEKRFGSWLAALKEFVSWVGRDSAGGADDAAPSPVSAADAALGSAAKKRRTRREISDRQRFRILVRDGFRCCACGASPLITPGTELHVDHVVPWSLGGETEDENLQTKCRQCNLGKGNAFSQ